jgi:hypothetical protein
VTAPDRKHTRWMALPLALAGVLVACEDATPTAEALCARAASCEQMDVLVSSEACTQQVKKRLIEASTECSNCVLSIPCSGMARVATGKVTLGQICPSCPPSVTRKSCATEHVLICGLATRPAASASASASASAAPPGSAIPSALASALPAAPSAPALGTAHP